MRLFPPNFLSWYLFPLLYPFLFLLSVLPPSLLIYGFSSLSCLSLRQKLSASDLCVFCFRLTVEGLPLRGGSHHHCDTSERAHACQDLSVPTLCCQSGGAGSVQRRDSEVRSAKCTFNHRWQTHTGTSQRQYILSQTSFETTFLFQCCLGKA